MSVSAESELNLECCRVIALDQKEENSSMR